jgi:hypothetical protein
MIPSKEKEEVSGYEYSICGTKKDLIDAEIKWPPIRG